MPFFANNYRNARRHVLGLLAREDFMIDPTYRRQVLRSWLHVRNSYWCARKGNDLADFVNGDVPTTITCATEFTSGGKDDRE